MEKSGEGNRGERSGLDRAPPHDDGSCEWDYLDFVVARLPGGRMRHGEATGVVREGGLLVRTGARIIQG